MTTLSNGAPITDAGKLLVTTTTPGPTWPFLGGLAYDPVTFALAVKDAVPAAGDPWNNGIRNTSLGQMYVTSTLPSPLFYAHGLPVSADGRVFASSGAGVGWAPGGWPLGPDGGISMDGLSAQPIFWAPLLTTLVPVVAGNPTFTFQRVTTPAYVADQDGILRQAIANEARFQGARRVRNLVQSNSQDFSAAWTKTGSTTTFGVTGPTGLADANTMTATGADGTLYQNTAATPGQMGRFSWWIRRRTGTGSVRLRCPDNNPGNEINITAQLDGTWKRFASAVAAAAATPYMALIVTVSGDQIDVAYAQAEAVDGQSNQAPGEYVSVGVLAAPYHGNAIDGVKYFPTTNGNSVPGANLVLRSQEFDVAPWTQSNVVAANDATVAAPDGTFTADKLTDNATNGLHRLFQSTPVLAAAPYTFSLYVKQGTLPWMQIYCDVATVPAWANFNLATGVAGNKAAGVTTSVVALPNGWFRCSFTFTTIATTGYFQIFSIATDQNAGAPTYVGSGQTMYLWGAQVEPGTTANAYNPTTTAAVPAGNIVTEAQGTLIPTATLLGYVAENAATNLCTQSQTFDNAGWSKENGTVPTPNTQTAPDGTLTADGYVDNATPGAHRILRSDVPVTLGLVYTYSVYLKSTALPWAQVSWNEGVTRWANFNLTTGAIGFKEASTTAAVVALPNGWFRCSITWTATVTGAGGQPTITTITSDVNAYNPTYIGTGQTMYLWGAQVETGSDCSSYIATTTVAVVRAVDSLTYPMATNLDGALATTYTEVYSAAVAGQSRTLLQLTGADRTPQFYETSKALGIWSGAIVYTANLMNVGSVNKNAAAWSGATASVCLNGAAVGTGAFAAYGALVNVMIGGSNIAPKAIQGSIRNVKFYATRLTDVELQALTA